MPPEKVQLIETLRATPEGKIPLLAWHKARLLSSCRELGYAVPAKSLFASLERHAAGLDTRSSHRIRLLFAEDGSYTVESNPLDDTAPPVRLRLHPRPLKADRFWLKHKTTRRDWYHDAQSWLHENPDFFDVIFCNEEDEVGEGTRSNVYIKDQDGAWVTPPLHCGLLPGVQRQALLDQGLVVERPISRSEFLNAQALRVSNALRGWLDAVF